MKIRVVCTAPYAVAISSGRHLGPGESAQVENDDLTQTLLENGQLTAVESETPADSAKPTAKTRKETTTISQETE